MRLLPVLLLVALALPGTAHAAITGGQGRDVEATAGQQAASALVATFQDDANTDPAQYTATINWGDGTPTDSGTVTCASQCGTGAPGYEVRGTHTWQTAGTYTVTVTIVFAPQQQTVPLTATARVAAAPGQPPPQQPPPQQQPPAAAGPPTVTSLPISAPARSPVTVPVAKTEPPAGPVRVVIDWGDGGKSPGTVGSDGTITGTHTFPRAGLHQIVTTVTAPGGTSLGSGTAVVAGSGEPAACETKIAFGPLRAEGPCIRPVGTAGNFEVRDARVRINGLDVIVEAGARAQLNKSSGRLVLNGKVTVRAGPIVLYEGRKGTTLGINVDASLPTAFNVAVNAGFSGFPIEGSIGVRFKGDAGAEIPVHLGLPALFGGVTGDAEFRLTMKDGFVFEGLRVEAKRIMLGGLEVKNLFVAYRRTGNTWKGGASLTLPSGLGLNASPPPDEQGVTISDGALKSLGATLSFPSPGIAVASGVFLNKIGFAIGTSPTRFLGNASFSTGSVSGKTLARIDGSMFIAFARPEEPYVTTLGIPARERRFTSTTFYAGGTVTFAEFANLASAFVLYQHAGYVELGGQLNASLLSGLLSAQAQVVGTANVLTGQFNAEAGARVCAGGKACVGGDLIASSAGLGACARFPWPLPDIGGYRRWSGGTSFMWRACDLGGVRVVVTPSARAAQAGVARSFTVARGVDGAVFGVTGTTDAPRVALVDPAGRRYELGPDDTARGSDLFAFRAEADRTTYFAIARPRAGTWRAEPVAGSAPISTVRSADVLPEPQIAARVVRRGTGRALTYRARKIEGQRIVFFERGRDVFRRLGTTTGGTGRIPFTPADGAGGRREIVARVESFGTPRDSLTVARFTAPGPLRPARPRRARLTAQRNGRLCATWRSVRGAARYEVTFRLRDGGRALDVVRRPRSCTRSLTSRTGGSVRIVALSARGRKGPAATARRR